MSVFVIFAFAEGTEVAWEKVCRDRPYRNGTLIQAIQGEGLEQLHDLQVVGFLDGDWFPSADSIHASCDNWERFKAL